MPMRVSFLLAACLLSPLWCRGDIAADRSIEQIAARALDAHRALHGDVQVHVTDGIVALTGRVDNRDERALAGETVATLPGVLAVDNRLELATPAPERADGWIALKVRSMLLLGRNVSATHTEVDVQDGVVTLTGEVTSELQRKLAGAYTRDVEGVRAVRNELVVKPTTTTNAGEGMPPANANADETITTDVIASLHRVPALATARISVATDAGVVSLRGRVHSQTGKDLAERTARQVPAVKAVANDLMVEAAE